jgi:hypothetical protein
MLRNLSGWFIRIGSSDHLVVLGVLEDGGFKRIAHRTYILRRSQNTLFIKSLMTLPVSPLLQGRHFVFAAADCQ